MTHPTPRFLPVGINIDGVLDHDGLPDPTPAERWARVAASGAFDFVEKNVVPGEPFEPYFELIDRHALPIGVLGGIFVAGRDHERARAETKLAQRLKPRLYNCQLFANHATGYRLDDDEVADFFLRLSEWLAPAGVQPSFEVHVDLWNEEVRRVERVAEKLLRRGVRPRFTLDLAHLIFKAGNAEEMAISGLQVDRRDDAVLLNADHPQAVWKRWLAEGWIVHTHARSAVPNGPTNPWLRRRDGRPGRSIQYPFLEPAPGSYHSPWQAERLGPWKRAVREVIDAMVARPGDTPAQWACEFLPFADCGGGSRYSVWDNNVACATWLRELWREASATGGAATH